jgi:hypothetical protein
VSKFVEKFRKDRNYNDDYYFEKNQYDKRKKREKQKTFTRQSQFDVAESDWATDSRKFRR